MILINKTGVLCLIPLNYVELFIKNTALIVLFSVNTAIKGPDSAVQSQIDGAAIDKCTSYALDRLDKQKETSYYKNKPVKVSLESDFNNEPEIDFRDLTKTTQGGPINVILDEPYT